MGEKELKKFNIDIENSVLGASMENKDIFLKMLDKGITKEDFYNTNNQKLFDSILRTYQSKSSTDVSLVCEIAAENKLMPSYITGVFQSSIVIGDIDALINELLELRANRELLNIAQDIQTGKLKDEEDIKKRFDFISSIKSKIGNVNTITTLDKVEIVDIYKAEKIPTGFEKIDKKILGFA